MSTPPRRNGRTATALLTAYGHSWIDSTGKENPEMRVAERTAEDLGMRVNNRGRGGSISTETAGLLRSEPPLPSAVFLLMTGLNDLRFFGHSGEAMRNYESALTAIFSAFVNSNARAQIVAIAQPHLIDYSLFDPANKGSSELVDEYNEILLRSTKSWSQVRVAVPSAWDPKLMLSADTVHPALSGHAYLSAVVLETLRSNR